MWRSCCCSRDQAHRMGKPGSCPAAMVLKPHQVAVVGCCWCASLYVRLYGCVCVLRGLVGVDPGSQKLCLLLFGNQELVYWANHLSWKEYWSTPPYLSCPNLLMRDTRRRHPPQKKDVSNTVPPACIVWTGSTDAMGREKERKRYSRTDLDQLFSCWRQPRDFLACQSKS